MAAVSKKEEAETKPERVPLGERMRGNLFSAIYGEPKTKEAPKEPEEPAKEKE